MKKVTLGLLALSCLGGIASADAPKDAAEQVTTSARQPARKVPYIPAPENLQAREKFADDAFGVFIHWGIYSMFGQGEWYLQNCGMPATEYAKAADGFYPSKFDAAEWVAAIKDAGAKYITITTRHHDGFSMFKTKESPYNIVEATPFGRDIIGELADECRKQGIGLNLYYSHIDWTRDDYPTGRTGQKTGKDPQKEDWAGYYKFMNNQLTELLTNYGPVGAIWFDGLWDHDQDSIPFDWQLEEQYDLIHKLQPATLVANNHHCEPIEGEDIQLFERDLPGENKAGLSGQAVSQLSLETCQTMNGSWGYRAIDQNYKDTPTLIRLLVGAAGKGANLLLNVGPQPSGEIPAKAREHLKEMGQWLRANGETVYGTRRGDFPAQEWGTSTRKGNKLFVHVFDSSNPTIHVPTPRKVKSAKEFATGKKVKFTRDKKRGGVTLTLGQVPDTIDYIVELITD